MTNVNSRYCPANSRRRSVARTARGGFTLIEMMIVISIMAVLAGITVPAAMKLVAGDRVTDGARQLQATLSAVRDRASAAGEPRGLRLIQDNLNKSYVRSMILIRPAEPISLGTARVTQDATRGNVYCRVEFLASPNDPDAASTTNQIRTLLQALPAIDADSNGITDYYAGSIRFGKAGPFLTFRGFTATGLAATPPWVQLDIPFDPPDDNAAGSTALIETMTYEIPRSAVPLEDSAPITLPGGIVIDLGQVPANLTLAVDPAENRLSRISRDETIDQFDILIAPDGRVVGSAARESQIGLWVRDESDGAVAPNPAPALNLRREVIIGSSAKQVIVVLYSRSGYVSMVNAFLQPRLPIDGFCDFNRYYENVAVGFGSGL